MIQVGLLTEQQAQEVIGAQFAPDSFFNPIEDIDGNWVISTEEIDGCDNQAFVWVKTLPLIDWIPPIYDDIY